LKDTISSFDLAAVIHEIKDLCIGAIINNIYQIDTVFIFKLKTYKGTINLLIEPARRVHTTIYRRPKPRIPPNFCMTLRKYLRRKVITEFKQYFFDRVLIINAARRYRDPETNEIKYAEKNSLICELFNRGELILLNDQNKVIISTRYKTMRDRRIIPNREFEFAPVRGLNLYDVKLEEFLEYAKNSNKSIVNFLASEVGIGGKYAEECCIRCDIDKMVPVKSLDIEKLNDIFQILKSFINKIKNKELEPVILLENDNIVGFEPFRLKIDSKFQFVEKENYNTVLDEVFSQNENIEIVEEEISETRTKISKEEKIIQAQKAAIEKLEKKARDYKEYGDLIYQNFDLIQNIIKSLEDARNKGYSWKNIQEQIENAKKNNTIPAVQYIHSIKPAEGIINIKLDSKIIPINIRLTPQQNATEFYNISKKSRKKIEGAKKAMLNTLEKLKKLKETQEITPKQIPKITKKRTPKWYEKFHWFYSSDGYLVIGGRDIATNDIIYKKYFEKNDIFIHADFRGSPAVIIKNGENIPQKTIQEAAQFTVIYSSAWKSKYMSGDAFWVTYEQVSQTPPSGQYLPKGSFMIRGKKNYLRGLPLLLAIGLVRDNDFYIPIAGPVDAIKKQTSIYIIIRPGDNKRSDVAKQIKNYFLKKINNEEEKSMVQNIPLDDIIRLLPGDSEIVEKNIK